MSSFDLIEHITPPDDGGEYKGPMLLAGYEDALLGIVAGWHPTGERFEVALYDKARCLGLMLKSGMDFDAAVANLESNLMGAYIGPGTPCFATLGKDEE